MRACLLSVVGTLTWDDGGAEEPLHVGSAAAEVVLHQILRRRLLLGHHGAPHLCQCRQRTR